MIALLVLVSIVVAVWALNAPGQRFLPSMVRLLQGPTVHAGTASVLTGRSEASGTFSGREVSIELKLRRGRHDQGYLVVSMQTNAPGPIDAAGIDAHATGDEARRALYTLAKHDLLLRVSDGWLLARWQPQGFVLFPGVFAESKWRDVLDSMHTVAAALDAATSSQA